MEHKHGWAFACMGVAAVMLGTFITLLQTVRPRSATHIGEYVTVIIGVAAVLGFIIFVAAITIDHPRVLAGSCTVEPRAVGDINGPFGASASATFTSVSPSATVVGPDAYFVYLHVWNAPKSGHRAAEAVTVELRYLGDGGVVYSGHARWSSTPMQDGHEVTQTAHEETLAANGNPHRFDVAVKFTGMDQCCAADDKARLAGWKHFPLGEGPIVVEVTAQGVGRHTHSLTYWLLTVVDDEPVLTATTPPLGNHDSMRDEVAAMWDWFVHPEKYSNHR